MRIVTGEGPRVLKDSDGVGEMPFPPSIKRSLFCRFDNGATAVCLNRLSTGEYVTRQRTAHRPTARRRNSASDFRAAGARRFNRVGIVRRFRADESKIEDGKMPLEGGAQNDVVEQRECDASRGCLVVREVAVVNGADGRVWHALQDCSERGAIAFFDPGNA